METTPTGAGYLVVSAGGEVLAFGDGVAEHAAPAQPDGRSVQPVQAPEAAPLSLEAELFARINAERTARGLHALRWDPELAAMAAAWSVEMSRSGLHHSDLDVQIDRLSSYHVAMAENIYWGNDAYATPAAAHTWFMGSPGHRSAMLETAYTPGGVGIACIAGTIWVTELFARPATDGNATFAGNAPAGPRADLSGISSDSC